MTADPATPERLGVVDTARLLGAYAWVEGRLFEVLGGLAAEGGPPPELPVLLDAHSQQHAWHASLFAERLPLVPGADAASLTVSPSPAAARLLEAVSAAGSGARSVAMLARSVLPRLVTGYRLHMERANPASDTPVVRALRLVVRDEVEELLDTEALLERLLAEQGPVGEPSLGSVGDDVARSGPGLVPWP